LATATGSCCLYWILSMHFSEAIKTITMTSVRTASLWVGIRMWELPIPRQEC
jgi:hypothetical protein